MIPLLVLLLGCPEKDTGEPPVDTGEPCVARTWYLDWDQDGYGDVGWPLDACEAPSGHVEDASDCDDTLPAVHPGAPETCDGTDEDCDGSVDNGLATASWYPDADEDGFGDPSGAVERCVGMPGLVEDGTDCDDLDPQVHPGADDPCGDGLDQDCDGVSPACPVDPVSIDDVATATYSFGAGFMAMPQPAWIPDVDGDGLSETVLGVAYYTPGLYVFSSRLEGRVPEARARATVTHGEDTAACLGWAVVGLPDTDGDGIDEILASDYQYVAGHEERAGAVWRFPADLEGDQDTSSALTTLVGEQEDDAVGWDIADAGDSDGDGVRDLAIGARLSDRADGAGLAALFRDLSEGTRSVFDADLVLEGTVRMGAAGSILDGLGDVDGDGLDDLAVGAPSALEGTVYLVLGGASGTLSLEDADAVFTGTTAADLKGQVQGPGDADGDGLGDLLMTGTTTAWLVLDPLTASGLVEDASASFEGMTPDNGYHARVGLAAVGVPDATEDGLPEVCLGSHATGAAESGEVAVFASPFWGTRDRTEAVQVWYGPDSFQEVGYVVARDPNGWGGGWVLVGGSTDPAAWRVPLEL